LSGGVDVEELTAQHLFIKICNFSPMYSLPCKSQRWLLRHEECNPLYFWNKFIIYKLATHLTDLCLNKGYCQLIAGLLFPQFLVKGLDFLFIMLGRICGIFGEY
jgi:hypothetical protein